MIALFSVALFGCYKDFQDLAEIDLKDIPFENPDLQSDGALVSTFTADLECPDGKPATFFAVYPAHSTPSKIAVVFHSGAFDYQDFTNEIGFHSPSRMEQQWAKEKVWETLGMSIDTIDPAEENTGALATALLDANVVQLYPANCWGDLWHNQADETDNNYELESFNRSGRTFAYWMTELIQNPNFPGVKDFQISQPFDVNEVYWIGLGNGSRAIAELLHRGVTPPKGILLDSPAGDLQPYRDHPEDFVEHNKALDRIFVESCLLGVTQEDPEFREECYDSELDTDGTGATNLTGTTAIENLSDYALSNTDGGVSRLAILWSDGDSQLPQASLEDALLLDDTWAESTWVLNTSESGHIFSNRDINASRQIVTYLLDGIEPTEPLFVEDTQE